MYSFSLLFLLLSSQQQQQEQEKQEEEERQRKLEEKEQQRMLEELVLAAVERVELLEQQNVGEMGDGKEVLSLVEATEAIGPELCGVISQAFSRRSLEEMVESHRTRIIGQRVRRSGEMSSFLTFLSFFVSACFVCFVSLCSVGFYTYYVFSYLYFL